MTEPNKILQGHERYYVSKAGSKVRLFGKSLKAYEIDWDWVEENVCIEAKPDFNMDLDDPRIEASCDCCSDSPWSIRLREIIVVQND